MQLGDVRNKEGRIRYLLPLNEDEYRESESRFKPDLLVKTRKNNGPGVRGSTQLW